MTLQDAQQVSGAIGVEPSTPGAVGVVQEGQHADTRSGWIEKMLSTDEVVSEGFALWAWRYLLAHLCFQYYLLVLERGHFGRLGPLTMLAALLLSFAGDRLRWLSRPIAFLSILRQVALNFPANANHDWLALVVMVTFMLVDFKRAEERALLLAMARWTIALLILHSGLQKVLHGTYFNGMMLATYVNGTPWSNFRPALEWMLEPSEFQRLSAAVAARSEGPYLFSSWLPLVVSNAIWVGELAAGAALIWKKTRMAGAVAAVALLVGIEVVAQELTFGLLGLNLLMLFFPVGWRVRVALLTSFAYVGMLIAQAVAGPNTVPLRQQKLTSNQRVDASVASEGAQSARVNILL